MRAIIAYHRRATAITVVAVLALFVAGVYAFNLPHDARIPPNPTLPQAYQKAVQALGSQAGTFYCLRASAMGISESYGPTEWHLVFYSTNGQLREVVVPTTGKIIVRDKEQIGD
jgi:hypothetical protein